MATTAVDNAATPAEATPVVAVSVVVDAAAETGPGSAGGAQAAAGSSLAAVAAEAAAGAEGAARVVHDPAQELGPTSSSYGNTIVLEETTPRASLDDSQSRSASPSRMSPMGSLKNSQQSLGVYKPRRQRTNIDLRGTSVEGAVYSLDTDRRPVVIEVAKAPSRFVYLFAEAVVVSSALTIVAMTSSRLDLRDNRMFYGVDFVLLHLATAIAMAGTFLYPVTKMFQGYLPQKTIYKVSAGLTIQFVLVAGLMVMFAVPGAEDEGDAPNLVVQLVFWFSSLLLIFASPLVFHKIFRQLGDAVSPVPEASRDGYAPEYVLHVPQISFKPLNWWVRVTLAFAVVCFAIGDALDQEGLFRAPLFLFAIPIVYHLIKNIDARPVNDVGYGMVYLIFLGAIVTVVPSTFLLLFKETANSDAIVSLILALLYGIILAFCLEVGKHVSSRAFSRQGYCQFVFLIEMCDDVFGDLFFLHINELGVVFFGVLFLQVIRSVLRDSGLLMTFVKDTWHQLYYKRPRILTEQERKHNLNTTSQLAVQEMMTETLSSVVVPLGIVYEWNLTAFNDGCLWTCESSSSEIGNILTRYSIVFVVQLIAHWITVIVINWRKGHLIKHLEDNGGDIDQSQAIAQELEEPFLVIATLHWAPWRPYFYACIMFTMLVASHYDEESAHVAGKEPAA